MHIFRQVSSQAAKLAIVLSTLLLACSTALPALVHASTYIPAAKVSFTFDDGLNSTYALAAPTLAAHGITGTDYVITGCVGMTTTPNTCRANTDTTYMTWAQIQGLQNAYNWEVGSHTVDHQCLASNSKVDKDDCQKQTLTTAQVDAELADSKAALATNGINATDFAPPYGDYNMSVLKEIAKYYASMRNFRNDAGYTNGWPYSDYYLQDVTVQETINTPATIEAQIDNAITNGQWLVLTFHEISNTPSQNADDYEYGNAELDQIAAYVQAKQQAGRIQAVTVNQALATSGTNLLPNSTFNDGIADGWTTDNAVAITADSANNGSYPDFTKSVKLTSGTSGMNAHLFSPLVNVTPGTTYALKNFLDVQAITGGEIAFYIDEYNASGAWISGQYKARENSAFIEDMNFSYVPSSASVTKASLQVIVAGTGITAYLDNTQWFPVTTPVTPANLIVNGTFNDGIADGWTTDDTTDITANAQNNGSPNNPVNSVALASKPSGGNGHLFSPLVAVSPTHTYGLTSWVNLKQITNTSSGEIAFYIDEYNASGAWISGQYKAGVHTLGATTTGFNYTPSSANVSKASLQIIVVGNAGIQAYIDDVVWVSN